MNRAIGVFLLILGNCFFSFGHNFNFSFTKLSSIESGLSQSTVNAVIRDCKGDFWIGTHQGLNHYTLSGLRSYFTSRNDSLSLPNNYIYDIVEDNNGQVWISTKRGVVTYNRTGDFFEQKTNDLVRKMMVADDGVVMGARDYILHYRDHAQMDTIPIGPLVKDAEHPDYGVFDMAWMKGKQKLLLGTRRSGIFVYDLAGKKVYRFTLPSKKALLSLEMASDGCVYASYFGDGFYRYDSNGNVLAHYDTSNSELNNDYILDIMESGGSLYLATDGGGINLMDLKFHSFDHVLHDPGNNLSLPIPAVTKLYKDEFGNLWAGSVREGVFLISDNYIKTFGEVELGNESGMSENAVTNLYEEGDKVWIGTDGGGLNLFDSRTNRFRHFENTVGGKIISITPWTDDELLISAFTRGFYLFNKKTGSYQSVTFRNEEGKNIQETLGYFPKAFRVTGSQILFVGKTVYAYSTESGRLSEIVEEGLNGNEIKDLVYQNDDFAMLKCGYKAFRYDLKQCTMELLFEVPQNENITAMAFDGRHILWVGTSTGLGYADLRKPAYHPLGSTHFSYVSYLHYDQHERLWICAHNMLFSYSLSRKKFTQWNQYDGFSPNEILSCYHRHISHQFIYLGGAQGFVKIDMDIPAPAEYESAIMLDDVLFNGKSWLGRMSDGSVQIPWNYSSLSVRVNVKNKDVFQQNHFQYKVAGDIEQTFMTDHSELVLPALSPGKYAILVSSITKNGDNTEPVHLVNIEVLPPWYATIFFRTFVVVLLVLIVALVVYSVLAYQKKNIKGSFSHYLQALLHQMNNKDDVSEVEEQTSGKETMSADDEAFVEKMNKIIADNISNEKFGVIMLAEELGISRASLYNKVKNLVGLGVNDYINRARIERSVYLLTHTDMSISEISYEVGFNYPRYFSTSFKNVKGITPSRFKEENRRNGRHEM